MPPATATQDASELPEVSAADPRSQDVFRIEQILWRARQIHREHGGLLGYDFDDWAQAWSEPSQIARTKLEQTKENGTKLVPEMKTEVFEPCFACGN